MPATIDALLPLSLLEAVRGIDAPQDDAEAEFVSELRNKRLGLSDAIYGQIRRYTIAAKRNDRTSREDAVAIARLIGRRSDAAAVFASAGRILARRCYATISPLTRRVIRLLPAFLARPIALRRVRRIAKRHLHGRAARAGSWLSLEVPASITAGSAPEECGCGYYAAVLHELIQLLVGEASPIEHVRCVGRGDAVCEWRADWRPIGRRQAVPPTTVRA